MDVGSMVNQGLIGMQRSQAEMTSSAQQITQASATPVTSAPATANPAGGVNSVSNVSTMNVVEPLLDIQAQQQVFDSSARVVQTADENLGRLIDTIA